MAKKNRRPKRGKALQNKQNDDGDLEKDEIVDQNDEDFFLDEIDKFHANKEKIFLETAGSLQDDDDAPKDEEDEVLGIESDEDVFGKEDWQEEDTSDDDDEIDERVISRRAWGKKRSAFYGADDLKGLEGSDREEAEMVEEQEVIAIQKRLAEQIDEDDIGLDILQAAGDTEQKDQASLKTEIMADFSNLSTKAQWKLARKDSPEIEGLIKDFKAKLEELKEEVSPLMQLVKDGKIPVGHGREYVTLKYRVYLAYLLNISFYLALKARKTPIQNHPVVSRLVQYRTVINQLAPIDKRLQHEIADLLQNSGRDDEEYASGLSDDVSMSDIPDDGTDDPDDIGPQLRRKRKADTEDEDHNEKVAFDYYKSLNEKLQEKSDMVEESPKTPQEETVAEERRAINYDIAKNKGLTQKKKKIDRNPRVKMRHKYKKAKIRRKGQVREHRPELKKYAGEASGIRIGLKKSITLQ